MARKACDPITFVPLLIIFYISFPLMALDPRLAPYFTVYFLLMPILALVIAKLAGCL